VSRHYTPDYSRDLARESRRTAAAVVPLVIELVHPKSVIDVGCGTASWLAEFRRAGISDVMGLDGPWIKRDQLQIPVSQFQATDLARPFRLARMFDVACCIEVAEHLPPGAAEAFIDSIASLAPIVLFSAAVPFQGGANHVNERWADYWQALFARHEFVAIDFFRSKLWDNRDVQIPSARRLLRLLRTRS
jgi:SAM-dependent methyltransferase